MKRLALLILVEILIISQTIYAGWVRTYGLHESTEEGLSLVQTDDGGYLIIGYTTLWGSGGKDIWLLRIDSLGDTLWTRTYGGPDDDYPAEISPTEDGNYLISAYSSSLDGVWFLKINRIGDALWTHLHKRLEGESPPNSWKYTSDGGCVMTGTRYRSKYDGDAWIYRTDVDGDSIWAKFYWFAPMGGGWTAFSKVIETSNGNYLYVGYGDHIECPTGSWLLWGELDEEGNGDWPHTLGIYYCEAGSDIIETNEGGYFVVGRINSNETWITRTDSTGDTLWSRIYQDGGGRRIKRVSNSCYLILSRFYHEYATLRKIDSLGNDIWNHRYTTPGVINDFEEINNNLYVLTGLIYTGGASSQRDLLILKTDSLGEVPLEVSPVEILAPKEGEDIQRFVPKARFVNLSTGPTNDFYCICKITGRFGDTLWYEDTVIIPDTLVPFESIIVTFYPEWISDSGYLYKATFYALSATGDSLPTRPMSVNFRWSAIIEQPPVPVTPVTHLQITQGIGQQIVLKYSDFSQGFRAHIYNAAGQKVDELNSNLKEGSLMWGDGFSPGVYFIVPETQGAVRTQKVVLIR